MVSVTHPAVRLVLMAGTFDRLDDFARGLTRGVLIGAASHLGLDNDNDDDSIVTRLDEIAVFAAINDNPARYVADALTKLQAER